MNKSNDRIVRHSLADRLIHWINATCWLVMFFTGIALLYGKFAFFGSGYSDTVRSLFGGADLLLKTHVYTGLFWITCWAIYIVLNIKSVIFFFKHVLQILPGDKEWIMRQPFILALGKKQTAKLGIDTHIPPQGFYNIGQRGFAICAVLGSLLLAATGLFLFVSAFGYFSSGLTTLMILLHFLGATAVFAFLLIHIYMAALVRAERPGLFSMFTGSVSGEYARHHHGLWYNELQEAAAPEKKSE